VTQRSASKGMTDDSDSARC